MFLNILAGTGELPTGISYLAHNVSVEVFTIMSWFDYLTNSWI